MFKATIYTHASLILKSNGLQWFVCNKLANKLEMRFCYIFRFHSVEEVISYHPAKIYIYFGLTATFCIVHHDVIHISKTLTIQSICHTMHWNWLRYYDVIAILLDILSSNRLTKISCKLYEIDRLWVFPESSRCTPIANTTNKYFF